MNDAEDGDDDDADEGGDARDEIFSEESSIARDHGQEERVEEQGDAAIVEEPELQILEELNQEPIEEEVQNVARDDDDSFESDPDELEVGEEGPVSYHEDTKERVVELRDKGRALFTVTGY